MKKMKYARYEPTNYCSIPDGLARALVQRKVGRNGWPVMVALCSCVLEDRSLGRMPAEVICNRTGLTPWQVARGMTELRDKKIILPTYRKTQEGFRRIDRSNSGHVARYCIAPDVWEMIDFVSDETGED